MENVGKRVCQMYIQISTQFIYQFSISFCVNISIKFIQNVTDISKEQSNNIANKLSAYTQNGSCQ